MNKYVAEVSTIAFPKLMKNITEEFGENFFIVSRTPEDIVLGNGNKNVKFSRANGKVLESVSFKGSRPIVRGK